MKNTATPISNDLLEKSIREIANLGLLAKHQDKEELANLCAHFVYDIIDMTRLDGNSSGTLERIEESVIAYHGT